MRAVDELLSRLSPQGVQFVELKDLFEVRNGYTPSKSDPSLWIGGDVPWFRMEDIRQNGRRLSEAIQKIPHAAVKGGRLFPANAILVATSATIGEHALVSVPHLSNQRFTSLSLKPDWVGLLDMEFVFYYCFKLSDWCLRNTTTSSFASVDMQGFRRFRFPIPPMEVQRQIVRVLDQFTELEAELEARRLQYAHYRNSLFDLRGVTEVDWIPLGDAGVFFGGLSGKTKSDFTDGNAFFVSYVNVLNNISVDLQREDRVRIETDERQRELRRGDIIFTGSSETPLEVGMSSVMTEHPTRPTYLNSFCIGYRLNRPELLEPEFAKHLFRSQIMRDQIVQTAAGVTRYNISKGRLAKVLFPVTSRDQQLRIAATLDKFDALVNDLSVGLPAELAARRKQYEYYRDKLLTFEEAPA